MKTRDDLQLAGLVHDLNNVLQTLVDVADLLSEDPRWEKLSATILRSVERGKRITDGIRRDGNTGTPFEQILSNSIAFIEDWQVAGRAPAVHFETQIEPGIVLSSNWAWERVFINLFLNAMRAMPTGGCIHVRARRLHFEHGESRVEITVADEGSGIAPELASRLFEPHVSGHASTGLGLHIVDTIVREDGGQVRAANRAGGRGAEFIITLPIDAAKPAVPQVRQASVG